MAELCFRDLQFSASSANLLGNDGNDRGVFKETFKGQPVAVKKFLVNGTDSKISRHQDEQHWEKLLKLCDNNLVQYLQCSIQDDFRYLVMELCQGSMLNYCRKTLDESVASHVKAIDVMWQITCGLDFLHRQKIQHGNLKLENVLFWKRDSKSKRVVVKLAGYGCMDVKTDLFQLGCLFYSAATKEEAEPNESVPLDSLTEIDDNFRALALDLISLLVHGCLSNSVVEAGTILRHPFFTRCTDEGSRLIEDSVDVKVGLIWNDKEKMQKWLEFMDEGKFPDEDFDDFKDILLESENKDTHKIVREAFKTTPQLFSEYVWHTAIGSGKMHIPVPKRNSKPHSIELQEELGKGTYGTVYKCDYTAVNGNIFPAACKKCNPRSEAEVLTREIETHRKLDHLFVVKYFDAAEKDSEKFIVMELCEGSLKDYVEGKLERIPKDSLDEKLLIGQITLGLAYIHGEGIIHKDLKLENILLKRDSSSLVLAKIADFGFAKELKPGKTEFSETEHPGTETYMAPELLSAPGETYPASFASDVYALGITIARIVLKGKHPFSTNEIWRKVSMIKGLVPQNLEGLSWDLIDLILKLTDKYPGKRPNMFLVLLHPYFVLTNDRTKRHFVDQIWTSIQLVSTEENKKRQMRKIFNNRNFIDWYETLSRNKRDSDEEIEQMTKAFKSFSSFLGSDVNADTFYPTKEYDQTIKEAITSEYDANVGIKITQMNGVLRYYHQAFSRYRLYQLIQRTPKLLLSYFWSHLQELDNESLSVSILRLSEYQESTCRKRCQSSQGKLSEASQRGHRVISELEWISYYYGDEELVDDLWNIKYTESYELSSETIEEMIKTVAKCNVSEQVWSNLLDRFGDEFGLKKLLLLVIKSYAPNAPKVTDMILHRCDKGIIEEEISSVIDVALLAAACNEGDWAAEIMQVLLKHGGNPNVVQSMDGYTPVHYAALNESYSAPKIIKLLLQNGANPNSPSIPDGTTPVHWAALNQGDYAAEILKQLLDSGGTFNVVEGSTLFEPIHYATINSGDSALELLELLLEKRGIDVIWVENGLTLLHFAMFNEGDCGPDILKKLLESGMNPNVPYNKKLTPLHLASGSLNLENQNISLMRDLLENGGDPNAVNEDGWTPIHCAAADRREHGYEKLKLLFDYKGNASINDKNGMTPLHYAIFNNRKFRTETRENTGSDEAKQSIVTQNNQIQRVRLILDNGGNPNAQITLGQSPVHFAVWAAILNEFSEDILQLLKIKGGNIPDEILWAPIHHPAGSSQFSETAIEILKILLEYGGDANLSGGDQGFTPLHFACKSGSHGLQLTEILLEHGGNPNAQNKLGCSPVHNVVAFNEGNVGLDILRLLLKKGGDPNLLNKEERYAPLHYAAAGHKEKGPEKIKILLENGGDPNLNGGENGLTPLHIACMNSKIHGPTITRILLENGGNPNALDLHKRIPLHLAIQQNENDQLRLETIKLLLEKGANPNAGDKEGRTPVHYVVQDNRSNSLKVLKLLLEHGGNILQEDNFGMTPHRLATRIGSKQYCQPELKKLIVKTYRKIK